MKVVDEFWLDYVQAGAGISSMLAPLFAIRLPSEASLLDIGCGFGFVVDFWKSRGGCAIGLEPSAYGAVGREKLAADIRSIYLSQFIGENPNQRFMSSSAVRSLSIRPIRISLSMRWPGSPPPTARSC